MSEHHIYTIGDVSRLTGIQPVTLRAWQRRYGLLQPKRTPKGHRLYDDSDLALIRQILAWLELGISIGQVKGLLAAPAQPTVAGDHWQAAIARLDGALQALDQAKMSGLLNELIASYPLPLLQRQILTPWLANRQAQEADQPLYHYLVDWLTRFFGRHLGDETAGEPVLLAGWGQLPPLTLLFAALALQQAGHGVILLPGLTPQQAPRLRARQPAPLLIWVGAGLSQAQRRQSWPADTVLLGDLLALYGEEPWPYRCCNDVPHWLTQEAKPCN